MNSLDFSRYVLGSCVAVATLAGCGGSQPQIGAPGAMPQTSAPATHADRGKSWTKRGASSGNDLVYAASYSGLMYVISYPQGQLVGKVDLPDEFHSQGICSDSQGDIFVPIAFDAEVVEYAHGGTQPTATLKDPGGWPSSCSVDPTTGNLAVTNPNYTYEQDSNVAVYADAQGDPTYYSGSGILPMDCGYDNQGNLFVGGEGFAELPRGAENFTNITLPHGIGGGQIQWDGKYITVSSFTTIYRLRISGSTATIAGKTRLKGLSLKNASGASWIQGSEIVAIGPGKRDNKVGFWDYPHSGKAVTIVNLGRHTSPTAVTVSVGSSR